MGWGVIGQRIPIRVRAFASVNMGGSPATGAGGKRGVVVDYLYVEGYGWQFFGVCKQILHTLQVGSEYSDV